MSLTLTIGGWNETYCASNQSGNALPRSWQRRLRHPQFALLREMVLAA